MRKYIFIIFIVILSVNSTIAQNNPNINFEVLENYFDEECGNYQISSFKKDYLDLLSKDHLATINWTKNNIASYETEKEYMHPELILEIGLALDSIHQNNIAEEYYHLAISQFTKENNLDGKLLTLFHLSINLIRQGKLDQAKQKLIRLKTEANKMGLKKNLAQAYLGFGYLHYSTTDYNKAIEYYGKSLAICEEYDFPSLIVKNLNEIGNCYMLQALPEKAIKYHKRVLKYQDSVAMISTLLELAVDYSRNSYNHDSVIYYTKYAIKLANQYDNTYFKILSNIHLAYTYLHINELDSSILYAKKSNSLAKMNYDKLNLAETYKLLSLAYNQKEEYKTSLSYYHYYFTYYDSLVRENANFEFAIGQYQARSAYRNEEIEELSSENLKQESIIKQTKVLLIIVMLLLLMSIALIYINRILNQKKNAEMKHKLSRFQMNPHFIFNSLNSLQTFVLDNDIKSASKYLTTFSKLMRSTLENAYHEDIPIADEIAQLELYLKLESLRFDHKFDYSISVDSDIDQINYKIPSLLIQPFVENAIWHGLLKKESGSKLLQIRLIKTNENIICEIEDNGIGREIAMKIAAQNSNKHKSLGTKITEQRLDILSAIHKKDFKLKYIDLKDNNEESIGTRVELYFPIVV